MDVKNNGLLQYLDYIVVPRSYLERIDVLVAYISNIVYSTQDQATLDVLLFFCKLGNFPKDLYEQNQNIS